MDRRRILIIVAAVVAVLGVALVYVYVRGANSRASEKYQTVTVLGVTGSPITQGESIADAETNGQVIPLQVAQDQLLAGYVSDPSQLSGEVALADIYPGEQLIQAKFGTAVQASSSSVPQTLPIPKGEQAMSITLSDTARVAGFVDYGSQVAIYVSGTDPTKGAFVRALIPKVTVIAIGSTTDLPATTTPTDPGATATAAPAPAEALPSTLVTLAVTQQQYQKIQLAQAAGTLSFGLLGPGATVDLTGGLFGPQLFDK